MAIPGSPTSAFLGSYFTFAACLYGLILALTLIIKTLTRIAITKARKNKNEEKRN